MKNRFVISILGLLVIQALLLLFLRGSPELKLERSFTPTPSITPQPLPPTAVPPTSIPTLIPATLGAPTMQVSQASFSTGQCSIAALDLIGAWVKAGKPETDLFNFAANEDKACLGSFAKDVQPLFNQPNIWFSGALACTACHGVDLKMAAANLSLVYYRSILSGSRRTDGAQGNDILSEADGWNKAKLYLMITTHQMPIGRPADSPDKGPIIRVGVIKP